MDWHAWHGTLYWSTTTPRSKVIDSLHSYSLLCIITNQNKTTIRSCTVVYKPPERERRLNILLYQLRDLQFGVLNSCACRSCLLILWLITITGSLRMTTDSSTSYVGFVNYKTLLTIKLQCICCNYTMYFVNGRHWYLHKVTQSEVSSCVVKMPSKS